MKTSKFYFVVVWLLALLFVPAGNTAVQSLITPLRIDTSHQQCRQNIQFSVSSIAGYLNVLYWHDSFVSDERLHFLPVCLEIPSQINQALTASHSSPVVIVNDISTAFVTKQQMFISATHPYHVFLHELAHLAYFADEYHLSQRVLVRQCSAYGYANKRPMQLSNSEDYIWQLLAQKNALEEDLQCSKHTGEDWVKVALSQWHFLHYADLQFIPPIYQHIWQNRL